MNHLRSTHTVVLLEVPAEAYEFIRAQLLAAGYQHAVDDNARQVDMTGIAITPAAPPAPGEILSDNADLASEHASLYHHGPPL